MARTAGQDKVRELQRTLYRAAKADPGRRFHALHDKVHRRDVLERAWELVRANRGAAGIDRQTIADIERYGVSRLHSGLMSALEERISDRRILKLLRAMLRAGVLQDGAVRRSLAGTPQGGVVSPVLCNVYLHRLDRQWPSVGMGFWSVTRTMCWRCAGPNGRPRTRFQR